QMKDPKFSATIPRCDGLILVTPEYNHGYPGLLKHALDMYLEEYIHKAVGICGVSAGLFGGARVIEGLLPVMRELGLVTIFWDVNFGNVRGIKRAGRSKRKQSSNRRNVAAQAKWHQRDGSGFALASSESQAGPRTTARRDRQRSGKTSLGGDRKKRKSAAKKIPAPSS